MRSLIIRFYGDLGCRSQARGILMIDTNIFRRTISILDPLFRLLWTDLFGVILRVMKREAVDPSMNLWQIFVRETRFFLYIHCLRSTTPS